MLINRSLCSVVFLLLAVGAQELAKPQSETATATVHIRLVGLSGDSLSEARVETFEATDGKQDFARLFQHGSAAGIPFGTYRLRTYAPGFWSADRDVRVFQSEVWVVMQLELGMGRSEGGLATYCFSGTVKAPLSATRPFWLRLVGVYSSVLLDGQTDEYGKFTLCGIPAGSYALLTVQDRQLLDSRPVQLPTSSQVTVDLKNLKVN